MVVTLRSEKTSVVALAVPTPSPREMKRSRPVASPVKRESTSTGKACVPLLSMRTCSGVGQGFGRGSGSGIGMGIGIGLRLGLGWHRVGGQAEARRALEAHLIRVRVRVRARA